MIKYLYGTCRPWHLDSSMQIGQLSMRDGYSAEFFNEGQFKDFSSANIVKISMPIPNDRYTGTIPVIDDLENPTGATVPKLTRFIMLRYSDKFTTAVDLTNSIQTTGANTGVSIFATPADAIAWVKANTDLVEETPGNFLITPAGTDLFGNPVPATYLTIV